MELRSGAKYWAMLLIGYLGYRVVKRYKGEIRDVRTTTEFLDHPLQQSLQDSTGGHLELEAKAHAFEEQLRGLRQIVSDLTPDATLPDKTDPQQNFQRLYGTKEALTN